MRQAFYQCTPRIIVRFAIFCCVLIISGAAHTQAQTATPPRTPSTPQATPTPNAAPLPSAAEAAQDAKTPEQTATPTPSPRSQLFTLPAPRPVPPVPSLVRLGVTSDNMMPLSLNEAIRRALEGNNSIEVARNDVRFAETSLRGLEGFYDPQFIVTPQLTNRVVPATTTFQQAGDDSNTISSTDFTVGPSVGRNFRTGGGRYDVYFNNTRSSTSGAFNTFNPSYQTELGIQFTQPLLRDRSIDINRRAIRIQRKLLEQTDADFRLTVIDVISQVQTAYWELVFALRDQQNRIANVNLARENFRLTEARVAAGSAAPLARAEVQTELSTRETELLVASQNVSLAENNLKALLLTNALDALWSAQVVPTDEPTFDTTPIVLQDALVEARRNRPELRRLRLQTEISDIDQQYLRNQTRPRFDIVSTVSTTGFAGAPNPRAFGTTNVIGGNPNNSPTPIIDTTSQSNANSFLFGLINQTRIDAGLQPIGANTIPTVNPVPGATPATNLSGSYGRSLRNLVGFENRNIAVGVRIQIPLRNRTAEANLAGARVQRTQLEAQTRLQEQTVETDVRNSAQQVETARRRVLTARTAREAAELQLEGERRLFENGRSTQFLLFQRENQLANSRNLELRAETDYNQALARLQRATSTTLQANNIFID